jgi:hypothetical protein
MASAAVKLVDPLRTMKRGIGEAPKCTLPFPQQDLTA